MDKNTIKKYAVWARRELIERVSQRALVYGITAKDAGDPNAQSVNGHLLSQAEKRQRQALIRNIKEKGYEQVMEEVAYTWFNRFAALRFMEVNGYLPSHIRVFTNDAGEFKPQILAEAIHLELDGLDMNKVYELENANKSEELFKYLLIVQCNALNSILPGMFQRIEDYTELLLPDYLLREGSVIEQMVTTIPEEDWTDQVQIIGWLYQYYNTEPKDKVFADLKKNIKITKENIPAATQLFTPDWIVHYMVENSLGRLWLEGHPNDALKSEWKYYLDEAEQEPEVQAQLATIRKEYAALKPEEIRVIDPCMGSGHILCVLFDVLVRIYEDYGYTAREAAVKIVENNLWGLDIDKRAAQLSYFAVMMKARQYDRRFFTRKVQPHVYAIEESNGISRGSLKYFGWSMSDIERNMALSQLTDLLDAMQDAKEYGSILKIKDYDWELLYRFVGTVDYSGQLDFDAGNLEETKEKLWRLVEIAAMLAQKYDVVVTNPPYMGAANMNERLSKFIKDNYFDYKYDFFAVFISHLPSIVKTNGFMGFFSPYVWMFIQSYEKLRKLLCCKKTVETLIQFEYSAFEEATVPVCTFTLRNEYIDKKGCYIKLSDFLGGMDTQREKAIEAINNHDCGYYYEQNTKQYQNISGMPITYWLSDAMYEVFSQGTPLEKFGPVRSGLQTSDNNRFLRLWFEVGFDKSVFDCKSHEESKIRNEKWYPHTKGGEYRKWYGNLEYLINWQHDGEELYAFASELYGSPTRIIKSTELYFQPYITWSHTTSKKQFAARRIASGMIFNVESPSMYPNMDFSYFMGLLNSKPATRVFQAKNQTFHFLAGDAAKIPVIYRPSEDINTLVNEAVCNSKEDWDAFETSWDFQRHPLISVIPKNRLLFDDIDSIDLAECYMCWDNECETRFQKLKSNEEELNRIFIDIYGLQDELTPEVEDKDVTVRRADLQRDIKSLISYAVGCMLGRYSLDEPGLSYAGGDWDGSKYRTFLADKDNIIPICDDEYFEDDIVGRFIKFIKTVYGKQSLESNLRFIADALGGKGSSREVIRNYFINDFYADHLKVYQKRPIYWLFDSGKKNGFKCLIYMHRYQPDTIARIRTDYVHEQQSRYRTAIADLEQRMGGASTSERVKLSKQLAKLQAQAEEIRVYEEKIHHFADQMIKIDLDDGVKHNYDIFKDVLAKIK